MLKNLKKISLLATMTGVVGNDVPALRKELINVIMKTLGVTWVNQGFFALEFQLSKVAMSVYIFHFFFHLGNLKHLNVSKIADSFSLCRLTQHI